MRRKHLLCFTPPYGRGKAQKLLMRGGKTRKPLMRAAAARVGWELARLLGRPAVWALGGAYTAAALVVCLFPALRASYFCAIESVPIQLMNFAAPYFLAAALTSMLSPVFAGERENGTWLIPAACQAGRRGRAAAKLMAACLTCVFLCGLFTAITFFACALCGVWDGTAPVAGVGLEVTLKPVWTANRHFLFAAASLTLGSLPVALFVLWVSCRAHSMLSAASLSGMGLLLEYLFHRFSFPSVLREYNLWTLLEPYSLFILELCPAPPPVSLLALSAALLPLCILAAWYILQKGK